MFERHQLVVGLDNMLDVQALACFHAVDILHLDSFSMICGNEEGEERKICCMLLKKSFGLLRFAPLRLKYGLK